jgi:hypothetical protein
MGREDREELRRRREELLKKLEISAKINPLAKLVIAGKIREGDTITADKAAPDKGEALAFKKT